MLLSTSVNDHQESEVENKNTFENMDFPASKVLQDEENRKRKYELCPRKNSEVEFVLWGVPKMCLSRKLQENDHASLVQQVTFLYATLLSTIKSYFSFIIYFLAKDLSTSSLLTIEVSEKLILPMTFPF